MTVEEPVVNETVAAAVVDQTGSEIVDSPSQSFLFGLKEIRTIMHEGELHFVAKDVVEALGYKSTRKAVLARCNCSKLFKSNDYF